MEERKKRNYDKFSYHNPEYVSAQIKNIKRRREKTKYDLKWAKDEKILEDFLSMLPGLANKIQRALSTRDYGSLHIKSKSKEILGNPSGKEYWFIMMALRFVYISFDRTMVEAKDYAWRNGLRAQYRYQKFFHKMYHRTLDENAPEPEWNNLEDAICEYCARRFFADIYGIKWGKPLSERLKHKAYNEKIKNFIKTKMNV